MSWAKLVLPDRLVDPLGSGVMAKLVAEAPERPLSGLRTQKPMASTPPRQANWNCASPLSNQAIGVDPPSYRHWSAEAGTVSARQKAAVRIRRMKRCPQRRNLMPPDAGQS